MKIELNKSPRKFSVNENIISDFGKIELLSNEMVSFKTTTGKEYDFVAKEWGFYASPSINGRLQKEGFKTALVVNGYNQIYLMVVEIEKMDKFQKYLKEDNQKIITWLDEWF